MISSMVSGVTVDGCRLRVPAHSASIFLIKSTSHDISFFRSWRRGNVDEGVVGCRMRRLRKAIELSYSIKDS